MKIIVTSKGKDLNAELDPRFGRAPYFIVYETEDGTYNVIDNEKNLNAERGVGVQAGQSVVSTGAKALITGNCGPNAFRLLSTAGVKVYIGAKGTVKQGIEAFENGKLAAADSANVQGHWM